MVKKIDGGFLIAIEGIDGAGKTTQVNELKKELETKGFEVITLKEPTTCKQNIVASGISGLKPRAFRRHLVVVSAASVELI